jgi:hypothetical protein
MNVHTPSDLSVHLITSGAGNGFERDANFMGGNCTIREKVVSDCWDLTTSRNCLRSNIN